MFTFGKIQEVDVEVFEGKENKVQIASRNKVVAEELNMIRVAGEEWYKKEVEISDLDFLWEESIEIKKSKTLYGEILQLNEIWQDKREKMKSGKWKPTPNKVQPSIASKSWQLRLHRASDCEKTL